MRKINFLFFVFLFFISFVSSADLNETEHNQVLVCLNESSSSLEDLKDFGIDSPRLQDTYDLMKNSYEAQLILLNRTGRADFEYLLTNCEKFFEIENQAYLSSDIVGGLEEFYSDLSEGIKNSGPIEEIFSEIYLEYENERYEKVEELVDEAYDLIIETKSSETALNVFYESTTRNIKNFFIQNYEKVIFIILFLLILFLIFRKIIEGFILNLKFNRLDLRKSILFKLIREAQSNYFDKGEISKDVYELRLRKFSDLIRDIESQELSLREKVLRNKAKSKFYEKELNTRKKKKNKNLNRKQKKMESRKSKKKHKKVFNKNKKRSEKKMKRAERKKLEVRKMKEKSKGKKKEVKKEKSPKKKKNKKIRKVKKIRENKKQKIEKKNLLKEKKEKLKIEKMNKKNLSKRKKKQRRKERIKLKSDLKLKKKETKELERKRVKEERLKEKRLKSNRNYKKFKKKGTIKN